MCFLRLMNQYTLTSPSDLAEDAPGRATRGTWLRTSCSARTGDEHLAIERPTYQGVSGEALVRLDGS